MSDPILRAGAQGPSVKELQNCLNASLRPSPNIATNGHFGHATYEAVLKFQKDNWLFNDGIVGDCTWNALRNTETYRVLHRVHLVTQPTVATCWAACAAMLLHQSKPVRAPESMLNKKGELINDSEQSDGKISLQFCKLFGFTLFAPQSWDPSALAGVLRRGPVMCNALINPAGYVSRMGSESHWIVFAGIRGDGTADGTTIRVCDPIAGIRGYEYSVIYGLVLKFRPTLTYQLFQR